MAEPLNSVLCRRFPALLIIFLSACVDPVEPEFNYLQGLPYIDALVGTVPGASYARIAESTREFGVNLNRPVSGATVIFVNTTTGDRVTLLEKDNTYVPPEEFFAREGETWELFVVMPGGKEFRSEPETISSAVPVSEIGVEYDPELFFSDDYEAYVPGHRITVDFPDPAGEENYYYWQFRSFEQLIYCRECFGSTVLRNGECIYVPPRGVVDEPILLNRYTYNCEEPCWQIRYGNEINIFSDQFSDGTQVQKLPVGDVVLYSKRNILVELQQFSLSGPAYRYYRTIKDLIDNNSGLNAPLPAALVGNLYNPADAEDIVLGRFTAAATTVTPIYIERIFVEEEALEPVIIAQPEGDETPPPPVFFAPCVESRFRTSMRPDSWPEP